MPSKPIWNSILFNPSSLGSTPSLWKNPRIFKRATVESDELDQLRREKRQTAGRRHDMKEWVWCLSMFFDVFWNLDQSGTIQIWKFSKITIENKSPGRSCLCLVRGGALWGEGPREGEAQRCGAMSNAKPGVDGVEVEEYDQERERWRYPPKV